jgi:hypothetical protein
VVTLVGVVVDDDEADAPAQIVSAPSNEMTVRRRIDGPP